MYGNLYNNIMQNSLQASRSLYIAYGHVILKMLNKKITILGKRQHLCRTCSILTSFVVFTFQTQCQNHWWKHISCKIILCFEKFCVWNVAWPSHNHTNSCIMMQNLVKSDLSQLHPPCIPALYFYKCIDRWLYMYRTLYMYTILYMYRKLNMCI